MNCKTYSISRNESTCSDKDDNFVSTGNQVVIRRSSLEKNESITLSTRSETNESICSDAPSPLTRPTDVSPLEHIYRLIISRVYYSPRPRRRSSSFEESSRKETLSTKNFGLSPLRSKQFLSSRCSAFSRDLKNQDWIISLDPGSVGYHVNEWGAYNIADHKYQCGHANIPSSMLQNNNTSVRGTVKQRLFASPSDSDVTETIDGSFVRILKHISLEDEIICGSPPTSTHIVTTNIVALDESYLDGIQCDVTTDYGSASSPSDSAYESHALDDSIILLSDLSDSIGNSECVPCNRTLTSTGERNSAFGSYVFNDNHDNYALGFVDSDNTPDLRAVVRQHMGDYIQDHMDYSLCFKDDYRTDKDDYICNRPQRASNASLNNSADNTHTNNKADKENDSVDNSLTSQACNHSSIKLTEEKDNI